MCTVGACGTKPRRPHPPLCQLVGNPSCIVNKERRLQYIRHVRSCRGRGQGRGQRATRAGQRAARCEVQKHKPTTANAPRTVAPRRLFISVTAFNFRVEEGVRCDHQSVSHFHDNPHYCPLPLSPTRHPPNTPQPHQNESTPGARQRYGSAFVCALHW
jgi:hypothetical protein